MLLIKPQGQCCLPSPSLSFTRATSGVANAAGGQPLPSRSVCHPRPRAAAVLINRRAPPPFNRGAANFSSSSLGNYYLQFSFYK